MESRTGGGECGGREERDPPSNNSRAHTTSPVLGWFGPVTMAMNSRHGKHEMLSKMSREQFPRGTANNLP